MTKDDLDSIENALPWHPEGSRAKARQSNRVSLHLPRLISEGTDMELCIAVFVSIVSIPIAVFCLRTMWHSTVTEPPAYSSNEEITLVVHVANQTAANVIDAVERKQFPERMLVFSQWYQEEVDQLIAAIRKHMPGIRDISIAWYLRCIDSELKKHKVSS
jgi:hypothetical protein